MPEQERKNDREFIDFVNGSYERIIGFEPDENNYKEVVGNMHDVDNAFFYNKALYSVRY